MANKEARNSSLLFHSSTQTEGAMFYTDENPNLIGRLSPRSVETAESAKSAEQNCCFKFCELLKHCFACFFKPCCWCFKAILGCCSTESPRSLMLAMFYLLGEVLLCITMIINWYTKTNGKVNIKEADVEMLLVIYMIAGILGMLVVFKKGSHSNFVIFTTNEKQASKYLMGSVYAFGGGSLFMTTLCLFTYAHCKEYFSHIVFNLTRFIYTLIQMLLLQRFSLAIFHRSAALVFLMVHILGTNICIWIFFLVQETKLYSYSPVDIEHDNCLKKNNVTKMTSEWEEYLTPFSMEFCLICAGLIYSMVSSMKHFPKAQHHHTATYQPSRHHEYSALSEAASSGPSSFIDGFEDDAKARAKWQRHVMPKKVQAYSGAHPGFLCGVTVSVIMAVSGLVIEHTSGENLYSSLQFHHIFLTSVSISQITALVIIVMSLKDHEHVPQNFRSDDTLLVISFTGLFGWELLCMISAIGLFEDPKDNLHEAITIFIHNVTNLITCLVQCGVIIRTLRFRNRLQSNKTHLLWSKSTMEFKMFWVSQSVVYLLMTNIGFWLLDSFFEIKHYGDLYYPVGQKFYNSKPWHFWSALLYPLSIFFRFHSAILLVEIWVRFGNQAKESNDEEEHEKLVRKKSLPSIDRFVFAKEERAYKRPEETVFKKQKRKPHTDPDDIFRKYWSR